MTQSKNLLRCLIKTGESKILENIHLVTHAKVECEKTQSAGDIQIWDGESLLFLLERKTCSDLLASLNGRDHQKSQMYLTHVNLRSGYIIEIDKSWGSAKQNYIDGFLQNRIMEDNFAVLFSGGPAHTLKHVNSLCRKVQQYSQVIPSTLFPLPQPRPSYLPGVAVKKSDVLSPLIFVHWLELIKGISKNTAIAVASYCGSPMTLAMKYQACTTEEEKMALLAKVDIGKTSAGNVRFLGQNLSIAIYKAYHTNFVKD